MSNSETHDIPRTACSPREFCRAVGIGKTHFYKQVKAGKIKTIKDGRKTLVPVSECESYLRRLEKA